MPHIEVDTYSVLLQRGGDSPAFTRVITLVAKDPAAAVVRTVFVYFFVDSHTEIGDQQSTFARAYAPIAEFDAFYTLVQSERPLFFNWLMDTESPTRMHTYWLTTSAEPLGEGPSDAS